MAIGIDPILGNIFFTLSSLFHLRRPSTSAPYEKPTEKMSAEALPKISVLIPLYREPNSVISSLTQSLIRQTYPRQKLEIIFVVEPDDPETVGYAKQSSLMLQGNGIVSKVVITDGKVKSKPYALNSGLRHADGTILAFYDAEDEPESSQVEDAVNLLYEKGYDIVQAKFDQRAGTLVSNLFMLDNLIWIRKYLPTINSISRCFPLSTKSLFIRREALEEIGGWPLVLTEDAYSTILLAEKGKKFGLLESNTHEIPPRSWSVHFRQRMRWSRGYTQSLARMLSAKLTTRQKFGLFLAYMSPVLCALSFVSWLFFSLFWLSFVLAPTQSFTPVWMLNSVYRSFFFWWSVFLAYIGNPVAIFSYFSSIADTEAEKHVPTALLAPLYWLFVGAASLASFFRNTKDWGKTVREL